MLHPLIQQSAGIGNGLFTKFIARPDTVAIAAVRDPSHHTAKALDSLPKGNNSKLIIVKYDALSKTAAGDAVETLRSKFGITYIDLVIAVAGISKYYGTVIETPIKEVHEHFEANTFGPLILFQAVWPLLNKALAPKFIVLSTIFGSTGDLQKYQFPAAAYGASKAAVNYFVRKMHFEHQNLIAFPINPGYGPISFEFRSWEWDINAEYVYSWVQTEMGNAGAKSLGMEQAPLTLDESIRGLLDKVSFDSVLGSCHTEESHSADRILID